MTFSRHLRTALALPFFALAACGPAGPARLEAHLPDTVSTAYMLFYDFNAATADDGKDLLKELAAVLKLTGATATINGFRNAAEDDELDQARLEEIQTFLIAQGVDSSKFQVLARGVAPAISVTDDGVTSRRVEVFIQPPL